MVLNGEEVEVIVEKKKIKNIYFRINEDGKILVTCPKYIPNFEINSLLEKNRAALDSMYKKAKKKQIEGQKIFYLGKELDYVHYKKVMFEGNIAFGPSVEEVNAYLEKNALPFFQTRLDMYINTFDNLPKFRLRIRKMKSRWGVCNIGSMTVTLNSLLIHKDPFLIDYVICHELSHFKYMNHSAAFWRRVEDHFPEYKKARRELKD